MCAYEFKVPYILHIIGSHNIRNIWLQPVDRGAFFVVYPCQVLKGNLHRVQG